MTALSFEVFPPKSLDASFDLWETVQTLSSLAPRFFSVTYGAGGSTRTLTQDAACTLRRQSGLPVAAHLTCVDATKSEVLATARAFADAGITDIVALRGDPTDGGDRFAAHPLGYANSCELIAALKDLDLFTIRVGCYPESHPDAPNPAQNIDYLKAKFDAGADEAISQFFFEAETFLRFRDACAKAGLDTSKLTPGILPVSNWAAARKFAAKCGTHVPPDLATAFDRAAREDRADLFALVHASELCDALIAEGVENLHFYTLNRSHLPLKIAQAIGVVPAGLRNVA
ncbi:MAG: methylenetetrahydrofolate reductase [Rhodobacteraceae bacterium]|nr:methylenetetrahydrofolate reductase [Paracoccaceae bacterium]